MRSVRHHVVVVALALFVASPAMAQPSEPVTVELHVADNMRFTPNTIHARPGQQVHVTLKNMGTKPKTAIAHNFVLLKHGANPKKFVDKVSAPHDPDLSDPAIKDEIIVATPLVGGGETTEATFAAPTRKGEYDFLCTFRGHFNLGMRGQLIVE